MSSKTITNTILMVRPARFGYNPQTAENNAFQSNFSNSSPTEISQAARDEFDSFAEKLTAVGVDLIVVEDTEEPLKLDAIFPNNWFSTHLTGTLVTYPMFAPMRRLERRTDIIELIERRGGYTKRISFEQHEAEGRFLEGTGSIILDRDHRIAYACRSIRTDTHLFAKFGEQLNYQTILFDSVDQENQPIYHTNVMMALGTSFCVICLASIADPIERNILVETLQRTGKEIIDLSIDQMNCFAGNMLQVRGANELTYLVMSTQAYESLNESQIIAIEQHTNILHSPLNTIETYGGGSARCMMAEIYLAK